MTLSQTVQFDVPPAVRSLCGRLHAAGEQAFLVGGSLRDLLRGVQPHDWDIATSATPQVVTASFKKVIPTGIAHGTVTVMWKDIRFEVTTFRGETGYSDGRHPDRVDFLQDIEADLARRDFTVNAIAWDPETGILHDPFGGQADIKAKRLSAVGDAATRFREDGLRILRGARFAASLDFQMDENTRAAVNECADCLKNISVERKREELSKLLMSAQPSIGLSILMNEQVLDLICAPLADLLREKGPDALAVTAMRLDLSPALLSARLAALLFDTSPGVTGWMEAFLIDRNTRSTAAHLLRCAALPRDKDLSDPSLRRLVGAIGRRDLESFMALVIADAATRSAEALQDIQELHRRIHSPEILGAPLAISELAINGGGLMQALDLRPGPIVGNLLQSLLQQVFDEPSRNTPETLLSLARSQLDR